MSRLRSLDSKISFFAFADIITAVSGVLIFIALLLATDLGRPTERQPQAATSEAERKLQEILSQQADVDAQNHRLQELFATADTAPDVGKLQADIAILRSQLLEERKKQAAVADEIASSQAAIAARDKILGLTDLKNTVQRLLQEVEAIALQNEKAHTEMESLEQQVARAESQLLKLRQRDGQLWLIPDKSSTTKEPILVTVSGSGATIERFDQPSQHKEFDRNVAASAFRSFLNEAKPLDQYLVFLVRPSGIESFQELVKAARDMNFDVGYDALEEDRQIHFSTLPAVDDPTPPTAPDVPQVSTNSTPSSHAVQAQPDSPPKPNPTVPTSPKEKSWWQKILEWVGVK